MAGRKLSDGSGITLKRESGVMSRRDVMSHRQEEVKGTVRRH